MILASFDVVVARLGGLMDSIKKKDAVKVMHNAFQKHSCFSILCRLCQALYLMIYVTQQVSKPAPPLMIPPQVRTQNYGVQTVPNFVVSKEIPMLKRLCEW